VISAEPADRRGQDLLSALAKQPGGEAVLTLAAKREDLVLVGGAVRDLLLGHIPKELDVTVAAGAAQAAESLALELSRSGAADTPSIKFFERFETACVEWEKGRVDLAQRRRESYARPGALPEVQPADLQTDLERRDFTLNAIALALGGPDIGELRAVEHALEDLRAGRLRVLHELSFIEDPTRLLRLARYSARLGFQIEARTAHLARQAVAAKALANVSSARIGAELALALDEAAPLETLGALDELGVISALGLTAPFDRGFAEDALALLPVTGSVQELLMAVLIHPSVGAGERAQASALLDGFEIQADARERILTSAFDSTSMAARLEPGMLPSRLRRALGTAPAEAVALAGALAKRRTPELAQLAATWLEQLCDVRLRIGGEDLLAAGVAQGPEVGLRLARALDMKLDAEIPDDAEAELRAALEAPV
jgi:tRNA nucleotidyltransferase (CCA-adding enzyme)